MGIIDKKSILSGLGDEKHIALELGCGNRKKNRHAIGIDMLDSPDVDIVGDVYEVLAHLGDKSVDAVYSYHFVEHVPDVPRLLAELSRVVKPSGLVEFVAPHFSNPHFFSDPTHRSFFGLYTFCYYADSAIFKRGVPTYGYQPAFDLVSVDLIFKASRPFVVRHGVKRIVGSLFNSCTYLKELYEENFCYLFPCYEVSYRLRRKESIG